MTGDRVHPAMRILVGCFAVVVSVAVVALVFLVVFPLLGATLTLTGIVVAIALAASILGVVLAGIGEMVIRVFRAAAARRSGAGKAEEVK